MALKAIGQTKYTGGRGKGVLGVSIAHQPSGLTNSVETSKSRQDDNDHGSLEEYSSCMKRLLVLYDYKANPNSPGGFNELSLMKGQLLEYISEHPDNEHWWKAKNEDGIIGFVPSSYVILKEDQALPWLERNALELREQERKDRIKRQHQQKDFNEGVGFGPPPKPNDKPYVYVSAYNRKPDVMPEGDENTPSSSSNQYYCDVCEKSFNGPKPYKAHMVSRAHKEEIEMQKEYGKN